MKFLALSKKAKLMCAATVATIVAIPTTSAAVSYYEDQVNTRDVGERSTSTDRVNGKKGLRKPSARSAPVAQPAPPVPEPIAAPRVQPVPKPVQVVRPVAPTPPAAPAAVVAEKSGSKAFLIGGLIAAAAGVGLLVALSNDEDEATSP